MRFISIMLWITLSIAGGVEAARKTDQNPLPPVKTEPSTLATSINLLGLPDVPVPSDNPQSAAKIELGKKLFNDQRYSIDGTVSCSKCHNEKQAFTDGLPVSFGNKGQPGTRNAPTVINAAFNKRQFWDGREPDLESQSKQPLINPVEHGLTSYDPILQIIRTDPDYQTGFQSAFGLSPDKVTIDYVAKAIASFERTVLSGNSAFDRYYFRRQYDAMTVAQIRGLSLFLGQGRCVSCHSIEQDHALFTDGQFHNIGIGINAIQQDVPKLAEAYLAAKATGANVDVTVLTDKKSSELGRFAVTNELSQVGAFKTPTLRDIDLTAPYMHDGSLKTLQEVMAHYNNGGASKPDERVNDFLDGGIRPLNLTDAQMDDLVAFMKALTGSKDQTQTAGPTAQGDQP